MEINTLKLENDKSDEYIDSAVIIDHQFREMSPEPIPYDFSIPQNNRVDGIKESQSAMLAQIKTMHTELDIMNKNLHYLKTEGERFDRLVNDYCTRRVKPRLNDEIRDVEASSERGRRYSPINPMQLRVHTGRHDLSLQRSPTQIQPRLEDTWEVVKSFIQ